MRRHPGPLLLAALAACAAPSRRLTPRVVQDPITLPCGMASVSITPSTTWYPRTGDRPSSLQPALRVGLTDRLELYNAALIYAFLDDAPGSPLPRSPLSLAVTAGASAIGYSSAEGWIVYPVLSLHAARHVADTWRLALALSWTALWIEKPLEPIADRTTTLSLLAARRSSLSLDSSVMRQVSNRVAVSLGAELFQSQACASALCAWGVRGADAGLGVWVRPADWLTLGLSPWVGYQYRPQTLAGPQDPSQPVDVPLRSIGWVQLWGSATFYW